MNSDIVLDNDELVLKGSTISIEGKATFGDELKAGEITASEITVGGKITTLGLNAIALTAGTIGPPPGNKRLTLKGDFVKITATAVMLDNAERRKAVTGNRRALVHDFKDGLTINDDGDYPGGVTIHGNVEMPQGVTTTAATVKGPFVATTITVKGLPAFQPATNVRSSGISGNGLMAATWDEIVLDGKTIVAKSRRSDKEHGVTEVASLDVIKELRQLRADVKELQGTVIDLTTQLAALSSQGG